METSIDEIIEHFNSRVSYDAMHKECYERVELSHQALANWRAPDFNTVIEGDTVVGSDVSKAEQIAADKATLQCYGRPYSDKGRPSGTYYKYARSERVPEWADIDSRKMSQANLAALTKALSPAPTSLMRSLTRRLQREHSDGAQRRGAMGYFWDLVGHSVVRGEVTKLREGKDPEKVKV